MHFEKTMEKVVALYRGFIFRQNQTALQTHGAGPIRRRI